MTCYRHCESCDSFDKTDVEYGAPYACPACVPPTDLTEREKLLLTWLEGRIQRRFEAKLREAEEDCLRRNSDD